jgi:membrane protease YdiL (CAAX protease family)
MGLNQDKPNQPVTNMRQPWGLWPTIGWSVLIAAAYVFVGFLVALGFLVVEAVRNPAADFMAHAHQFESNGLVLSVSACASAPVTLGLVALFIRLRRGPSLKEYLRLNVVSLRVALPWMLALAALLVLAEFLARLFDRPVITEFTVKAFTTAQVMPLFWFALVVVAPIEEEVFFRGFLLEGLIYSRIGAIGGVFLTSLAWAIVHMQYDVYDVALVFVLGLLIGLSRLITNSLYTSIAIHSLNNLVELVRTALIGVGPSGS